MVPTHGAVAYEALAPNGSYLPTQYLSASAAHAPPPPPQPAYYQQQLPLTQTFPSNTAPMQYTTPPGYYVPPAAHSHTHGHTHGYSHGHSHARKGCPRARTVA